MEIRTSQSHPIRVDFVRSEEFPILNNLGMTFAPGKKQPNALTGSWERDLESDIAPLLDEYHADVLVSVIEQKELEELGIAAIGDSCDVTGIEWLTYSVVDGSIPSSMDDFAEFVEQICKRLETGKRVVIHCKGGLGRTGLTAACAIVEISGGSVTADEAIAMVRDARPQTIETKGQEEFVRGYWEVCDRKASMPQGKHYLIYWQERSVLDHASNGLPLDVVAGNQFAMVERGDQVWVVTLNEDRELFLAGHLLVGEIVEYEEATKRMPNAGLWQAEYYAFPEEGTEEFLHPIPLAGVAAELRFRDENADRLVVNNGQVNPAQLRTIRELTEESAVLITDLGESRELPIDEMTPEERPEFFLDFVEENPDEPAAHYNLGVVLNENGLDEEAVQAYREAVRLDAGYMPAHFNLGATLKRLGRDDEAIEAFNGAVLANHEYAPAHFMLGSVYLDSGQFKRAIEATETGLRYAPDDAGAHHNIALGFDNGYAAGRIPIAVLVGC